MLHARHRRRRSQFLVAEDTKPRLLVRFVIGALVIVILWYLGKTFLSFFTDTSRERVAAQLMVQNDDPVQVSLQGGDMLRAEAGLKLYEGDMVSTRIGGNAIIGFFDDTYVRLDRGTEVVITQNEKITNGVSHIGMKLNEGRLWVHTGSAEAFTGSITRMIETGVAEVSLPSGAEGLISADTVFFAKADGIGAEITLTFSGAPSDPIILSEGQGFTLSQEARSSIESGGDPYAFRDPVTQEMLADTFVTESRTAFASAIRPIETAGTPGEEIADNNALLTVTSPLDQSSVNTDTVLVSGQAGSQVSSIDVNGYNVTIAQDGTFSQELALPDDDSVTLNIEARDKDGITLAEMNRTVLRVREPPAPPTITAPGGSEAVIETTQTEVEIRGTPSARAAGIIVNDYRLQLFQPGDSTWSYLASTQLGNMHAGENVYNVYAVDSAGNVSDPVTITIILGAPGQPSSGTGTVQPPRSNNAPLAPGSLSVVSPQTGTEHTTSETEILIEGKTSTSTHTVSVNDYDLQLYEPGKDFWNYIASTELNTLKRGRNTYHVVARNDAGQIIDELTYTIILEVQ